MILRNLQNRGFTLLELMVGLIIFAVGALGFSGMVVMQAKANRSSKGLDESATIMQSQVEALNNVQFEDLGNSTGLPTTIGLTNGSIWVAGPLNRNSEDSTVVGATGPFIYYRNVVICWFGMTPTTSGTSPFTYCGGSVASNRPPELSCTSTSTANNREKLVRVLVGWTDRDGRCHYKNTDFVAFRW